MLKKLFCKHTWGHYTWNYVKCTKCKKVKDHPALAGKLMSDHLHKVYDKHYGEAKVSRELGWRV